MLPTYVALDQILPLELECAYRTLVRSLVRVHRHVLGQHLPSDETWVGLRAQLALVRPLLVGVVLPHVDPQLPLLPERSLADGAFLRLLSSVKQHVRVQLDLFVENLVADVARMAWQGRL